MPIIHRTIVAAAASVLALLLASAASMAGDCGSKVNLKRTAERTGQLGEMIKATHLAGLDDPEVDVGPLTLLAPTDEAFQALPEGFRARLLAPENRQHLTALLMHHALFGEYSLERLKRARSKNFTVGAVDGSEVEFFTHRGIDIEGAKLVEADIMATDGVIHLIDKVLIPPSVKAALWEDPSTKVAEVQENE